MYVTSISPKYQIVIPKAVREMMHLQPGKKLQVFCYQNRLELVLLKDIKKMRGSLKGMKTVIDRAQDRA